MKKMFRIIVLATLVVFAPGLSPASTTIEISEGGIGDLLLHPIYDVRTDVENRTDGWQNYMVIENMSGKWTACYVRFRSWRTGIETCGHVILLSPYDVFYMTLSVAVAAGTTTNGAAYAAGDLLMMSDDYETCKNSGLTFNDNEFWCGKFQDSLLQACGFSAFDLQSEIRAGHIEVIGLWQLRPGGLGGTQWNALNDTDLIGNIASDVHDNGHPGNVNVYDLLDSLYYRDASLDVPAVAWGHTSQQTLDCNISGPERGLDKIVRYAYDCGDVLTAALEMGDTGTARYEVTNFTAVSRFRSDEEVDLSPPANPINWQAMLPGSNWQALDNERVWTHRDGFIGGAIVFPAGAMTLMPDHSSWYYVNENWATWAGPGLRDGDTMVSVNELDLDPPPPPGGSTINDFFNDMWSLNDLERILLKDAVWYHFFTQTTGGGAGLDTNVIITFPAKHYHFFFRDWPVWIGDSAYNAGAANFASVSGYWDALKNYRDDSQGAPYACQTDGSSIFAVYANTYGYGAVAAVGVMFDMMQNVSLGPGGNVPPGSPWTPADISGGVIPNEVSIINVANTSGTGLYSANWLLDPDLFEQGHLFISGITMTNGRRAWDLGFGPGRTIIYNINALAGRPAVPGSSYQFAPIGIVQYTHSFGAPDTVVRSCAEEWHYVPN